VHHPKNLILRFHGWDETVTYVVSIIFFLLDHFFFILLFFFFCLFFALLHLFYLGTVFFGPTPHPNLILGTSYLLPPPPHLPTYLPPFLLPTHLLLHSPPLLELENQGELSITLSFNYGCNALSLHSLRRVERRGALGVLSFS
jgi:hypothetical protein